jgi:hypothetical protein
MLSLRILSQISMGESYRMASLTACLRTSAIGCPIADILPLLDEAAQSKPSRSRIIKEFWQGYLRLLQGARSVISLVGLRGLVQLVGQTRMIPLMLADYAGQEAF